MYEMMIPLAGAGSMAHPAMIAATRAAYRATCATGDPLLCSSIKRAWNRADAEMLVAYLDGLLLSLRDLGYAELWCDARAARDALVEVEGLDYLVVPTAVAA